MNHNKNCSVKYYVASEHSSSSVQEQQYLRPQDHWQTVQCKLPPDHRTNHGTASLPGDHSTGKHLLSRPCVNVQSLDHWQIKSYQAPDTKHLRSNHNPKAYKH